MAKETTTEKYIKKAVEATSRKLKGTRFEGCEFIGVKFDEKAIETIEMIASALEENATACAQNAIALGSLAQTLSASNVKIDTMVNISPDSATISGGPIELKNGASIEGPPR